MFLFFVNKHFDYEDYTYNGCYNLLMRAFSLNNIAVLNIGDLFY